MYPLSLDVNYYKQKKKKNTFAGCYLANSYPQTHLRDDANSQPKADACVSALQCEDWQLRLPLKDTPDFTANERQTIAAEITEEMV